ncbi:alpha/beta fold hydrolase [Phytomonospora sp. NPDC050363]|uniref:alpha/beta hydrolase family protein n=1 Tax=Phytomonospora sp. NPDC050363 TaxID=3155642 RepID=UPI0033E9BB31
MTPAVSHTQDHIPHQGQRLGVHRYPSPGHGPAVLILPAMGVPAGYYRRFAADLTEQGANVAVADLRGTGSSSPRAVRAQRYGYAELVADVPVILDHLIGRGFLGDDGRRPLMLLGHSLGGHIASLYLATTPDTPVRGLTLVACGIPYHALYGWRSPFVHGMATTLRTTARALGHWPGTGFAGRQTHGIIRDWAHTVHKGRFVALAGVDADQALASVRQPVFAVTVDADQFTPPVTSEHLCAKFTGTSVTRHHYTTEEAGGRLDHFMWARSAAPLAARVTKFAAGL